TRAESRPGPAAACRAGSGRRAGAGLLDARSDGSNGGRCSDEQGAARTLGSAGASSWSLGSYAESRARPVADLGRTVLRREADLRRARPPGPAGGPRAL